MIPSTHPEGDRPADTPAASRTPSLRQRDPAAYRRLLAEARAPYRPLRQFIYVALGASGFIGAVVFLSQILAGRGDLNTLGNLALQLGAIAGMAWLYRLDRPRA